MDAVKLNSVNADKADPGKSPTSKKSEASPWTKRKSETVGDDHGSQNHRPQMPATRPAR